MAGIWICCIISNGQNWDSSDNIWNVPFDFLIDIFALSNGSKYFYGNKKKGSDWDALQCQSLFWPDRNNTWEWMHHKNGCIILCPATGRNELKSFFKNISWTASIILHTNFTINFTMTSLSNFMNFTIGTRHGQAPMGLEGSKVWRGYRLEGS